MSNVVQLHFTPAQLKKAMADKTFQCSADTLKQEPNVSVALSSKADVNRLIRNVKKNKGFRFATSKFKVLGDQHGGAINWGKTLKTVGRLLKPVGHKLVDMGAKWLDSATPLSNSQISNLKGVANNVIDGKKVNLKSVIRDSANEPMLTQQEDSSQTAMDAGFSSGSGLKRGKFVKGSQEAKDFMASLRAKRGKGIAGDAVRAVGHQVARAGRHVKAGIKDHVKMGLNGVVLAGTTALGTEFGNPVAGFMAGQMVNHKLNDAIDGWGIAGGAGDQTLLNRIHPTLLKNKGLTKKKVTGGSFLAPYK